MAKVNDSHSDVQYRNVYYRVKVAYRYDTDLCNESQRLEIRKREKLCFAPVGWVWYSPNALSYVVENNDNALIK